MGQITPHEWTTGVKESDELSSILAAVFDDIRRKFTSNVKNEFMVSIRPLQSWNYRRFIL